MQEYVVDLNQKTFLVTADDRFVMIRTRAGAAGAGVAGELNIVQNFFEELKAKVGN